MTLPTGYKIGNYEIHYPLGHGGMATVYLAHDEKFNTQVAIKVLNREYTYNDNIRKRFISEARNMYRMSHSNIVKVTDLLENGNLVAFVMELIEGETLKQYLDRKGALNDIEISTIFQQMLEAVGYVHGQNLVHRDIKPSNFMLNRAGRLKLMDFGIAKHTDVEAAEYTQTGTGAQMGTPLYMSPEQITESRGVTNQSDIYSLGVLLWQMASGRKPHDGGTLSDFQIKSKIVNEALPLLNSMWDPAIQKATSKDVHGRYPDCAAWKLELFDGDSPVKSGARQPVKKGKAAQPTKRSQVGASGYFKKPPKSWLIESIMVTLLCCLPLGIIGIVNASRVESRFYAGDEDGALRASRAAGRITLVSFLLGLTLILLFINHISKNM